jgi:hypothetical protein
MATRMIRVVGLRLTSGERTISSSLHSFEEFRA